MIMITVNVFEDGCKSPDSQCGNGCGVHIRGSRQHADGDRNSCNEEREGRGYYDEGLEGFCEPDFEV